MGKKQFKAESKRLLDLMINSIYTNKEIFLREIISNASDAIDKLCYISLTDDKVGLERSDYRIRITVDKDARTITVSDNGIGMTQEEVRSVMGEPMIGQVYNTEHHWFYYTRTRWSDGMATRDECTPVVFDELGLLIGIGNQFYKENYSITFWSDKSIEKVIEE